MEMLKETTNVIELTKERNCTISNVLKLSALIVLRINKIIFHLNGVRSTINRNESKKHSNLVSNRLRENEVCVEVTKGVKYLHIVQAWYSVHRTLVQIPVVSECVCICIDTQSNTIN